MGYAPIAPSFKPGIKVIFISQRAEIIFGIFYNLTERQSFLCDYIRIISIISNTSPETELRFSVVTKSGALESCRYVPLAMGPSKIFPHR
jgi:hypothetical protein